MQTFSLSTARIAKYKGEILSHAVPMEVLGRHGRPIPRKMGKNQSDTYVARRFLPYGATAASPNTFYSNGTGDRGNVIVQAHQTAEGVTPNPETITPTDTQVVIQQYSCLYGFTDKTYNLYEDDIPKEMIKQVGERVTLVNDTMMTHPIHLHGMWMHLENGAGEYLPRKHTVIVKPAERVSVAITADAPGRWAFHCHLLLHMEAGMFRVVEVSENDRTISS